MADEPARGSRPLLTMLDWIGFVVTGTILVGVLFTAVLFLVPAILILANR